MALLRWSVPWRPRCAIPGSNWHSKAAGGLWIDILVQSIRDSCRRFLYDPQHVDRWSVPGGPTKQGR